MRNKAEAQVLNGMSADKLFPVALRAEQLLIAT
jgi:hypothetical protein